MTATVSDATSGAVSGTLNRLVDTSSLGLKTTTLVGMDRAGNQRSTPCPYNVGSTLCKGLVVTILGTAGNDSITGTPGADVIHGLYGADTIDGGGGHDTICGGDTPDVIRGGQGTDVIDGGAGNDDIYGGPGNDDLDGGANNDSYSR